MRFRLVPPVVALVFASAAAAAAPPPGDAGKAGQSPNEDLVELGRSLLDEPDAKPAHKHHRKHPRGAAAPVEQPPASALVTPAPPGPAATAPPVTPPPSPAQPVTAPALTPPAAAPIPPAAAPIPPAAAPIPPAAGSAAARPPSALPDAGAAPNLLPPPVDAGAAPALLPATVSPTEDPLDSVAADDSETPPVPGAPPKPPRPHRRSGHDARVRSGKNYPMQGAIQSPLARIGIPAKAVPAVATVAAVGATAFWPFLIKTLTGLLKSLLGSYLKNRAKKNKKVDDKQRHIVVLGFRVRPAELGSLFLAATVYGLAVCYTLKGWKLDSPFVLRQEVLVLGIYYSRSFIRFVYERMFGLVTQFRFWPGGGLLCLGSAYLGNTLGTVGYDLEAAKSPEAAERAVRLKVWLIVIALGMALAFFTANWLYPQKVLQSGRLMTSGMALAEILPITPMPGQKIYRWRRRVWVLLCVLVVPTFFLINFFL